MPVPRAQPPPTTSIDQNSKMPAVLNEPITDLGGAHELPRIEATHMRALNQLYGCSAPVTFAVRGTSCELRWSCEAWAAVATPRDTFRFRLGAYVGHLGIDHMALPHLLGEPRFDRLPGELQYVLLADAVNELVGRLEQLTQLRFEWAPPVSDPSLPADASARADETPWSFDEHRAAFFSATVTDHRFGGCVQFEDGAALHNLMSALDPASPVQMHAFEWLRIPIPFRLGTTRMSLREIGGICPGDIISVLDWSSSGKALRVTAEIGGLAGHRLEGLAENTHITIQPPKDHAMNRDLPTPSETADDQDTANLPLDRLDALEVAVRFDVAGLSVSLGELKSIRAGHVFDLGQPLNRCTVRILAHGNVLGNGHLVAVGDRLGVRVAEFAPNETVSRGALMPESGRSGVR